METVKCTRCHSKKPVEEFGYNKLGQPWHNCIKCREKRKEYKKTTTIDKKKPEVQEVFDHVRRLLSDDPVLEKYYMLFGMHKDRVMIEIPVEGTTGQATVGDIITM